MPTQKQIEELAKKADLIAFEGSSQQVFAFPFEAIDFGFVSEPVYDHYGDLKKAVADGEVRVLHKSCPVQKHDDLFSDYFVAPTCPGLRELTKSVYYSPNDVDPWLSEFYCGACYEKWVCSDIKKAKAEELKIIFKVGLGVNDGSHLPYKLVEIQKGPVSYTTTVQMNWNEYVEYLAKDMLKRREALR